MCVNGLRAGVKRDPSATRLTCVSVSTNAEARSPLVAPSARCCVVVDEKLDTSLVLTASWNQAPT